MKQQRRKLADDFRFVIIVFCVFIYFEYFSSRPPTSRSTNEYEQELRPSSLSQAMVSNDMMIIDQPYKWVRNAERRRVRSYDKMKQFRDKYSIDKRDARCIIGVFCRVCFLFVRLHIFVANFSVPKLSLQSF
jgi:hypothetical protein